MMLVDSREQGKVPKAMVSDYKAEVKLLDGGDYWYVGTEITIVERMTYSDFVGKVKSGRLWTQAKKCLELGRNVYFLLENPKTLRYSRLHPAAMAGALFSVMDMGVKCLYSRDADETIQILRVLYGRCGGVGSRHRYKARVKPRGVTARDQAVYMLMGVTGIGEKTALDLLEGRTLLECVEAVSKNPEGAKEHAIAEALKAKP